MHFRVGFRSLSLPQCAVLAPIALVLATLVVGCDSKIGFDVLQQLDATAMDAYLDNPAVTPDSGFETHGNDAWGAPDPHAGLDEGDSDPGVDWPQECDWLAMASELDGAGAGLKKKCGADKDLSAVGLRRIGEPCESHDECYTGYCLDDSEAVRWVGRFCTVQCGDMCMGTSSCGDFVATEDVATVDCAAAPTGSNVTSFCVVPCGNDAFCNNRTGSFDMRCAPSDNSNPYSLACIPGCDP